MMPYYLCGPMSGYPQANFPAFYAAAKDLRARGYDIISPAELDDQEDVDAALASVSGLPSDFRKTWGQYLSRDVLIVSEQCDGIIFLPDWFRSRGARLEAFVGCLSQRPFEFLEYHGPGRECEPIFKEFVLFNIVEWTREAVKP